MHDMTDLLVNEQRLPAEGHSGITWLELLDMPHVLVWRLEPTSSRLTREGNREKEREAVCRAVRRLIPHAPWQYAEPEDVSLLHSPLGAPRVDLSGNVLEWARENEVRPEDLHISFSHDGDVHVTLLAYAR